MPALDVSAFLDDDKITLSGVVSDKHPKGKSYNFPQLSWADTLRMRRIFGNLPGGDPDEDIKALLTDDDGNEIVMHDKLMGPTLQQLVDDGVTPGRIGNLEKLLITFHSMGEDVTKIVLESAEGEAQARGNRAARRAAAKKQTSSPRKAGSSSSRASGAKSTRTTPAASRGRGTSTNSSARKSA